MSARNYWSEVMHQELLKGCNLYDVHGDFRTLHDIMQDIGAMWNDAISAPNFTKSVFDSDDCDIDDYIELATDEDFKVLFGVD